MMAHLVYRGSSGVQHFSGSKYVNPELGTHRFCIRTGTGKNDVIKYGLTTQSSASEYCGFKMKVSNKDAYIGRYQGYSSTASEIKSMTTLTYYSGSYWSFKGSHQYTTSTTNSGYAAMASYESRSSYETTREEKVNITKSVIETITKRLKTYYTSYQTYTSGYYQTASYMYSTIQSSISKTTEQPGNPNFDV